MLRLIIILLATLVASTGFAQQQLYDLIHLDDGTVILGTIVGTLRGESVRIITDDGDSLLYESHRVVKITRAPRPYSAKSPATALAMSCVFPSLGQFYNEDREKGHIILGINALCLGGIVTGFALKEHDYDILGKTFIATSALYLAISWIVSMEDAYTSAEEINRQIYLSPSALNVQPINTPNGFGVRLAFGF